MDFYDRVGVLALGSRLRRLGDQFAEDGATIYKLYGTDLQPRWFPVFYRLAERGEETVSAIAADIGQSHASVSQILKEMTKKDYVELRKRETDGRKTFVRLTGKGRAAKTRMNEQCTDVEKAAEKLLTESEQNLWTALIACEKALAQQPLLQRVKAEKKLREQKNIRIIDYSPRFAQAFRELNEQWIKKHFKIEDSDRRALNHPKGTILKGGGHIFMAVDGEKPIGTCALIPHGDRCFELAKMAVLPAAQGKGVGELLGRTAIAWAKQQGADRLYLESNTGLEAAINLYHKLGFTKIVGPPSPYQRCNIQMELMLSAA